MHDGTQKSFISETGIIFAVPLVGYLFDYTYEAGFCDFLNIPRGLIAVSISSLIKTCATLLATYLTIFLFASLVQTVVARVTAALKVGQFPRTILRALYVPCAAAPLYLLGNLYSFDLTPRALGGHDTLLQFLRELYATSAIVAVTLLALFVAAWSLDAIWSHYGSGSVSDRVPFSGSSVTGSQLGMLILILTLDGAVLSYVGGLNDANRQVTFLVTNKAGHQQALVKTYGDLLLLKTIVHAPDRLADDLILRKVGETEPTEFETVHLEHRMELKPQAQDELGGLVQLPRTITLVEAFALPLLISLTMQPTTLPAKTELRP